MVVYLLCWLNMFVFTFCSGEVLFASIVLQRRFDHHLLKEMMLQGRSENSHYFGLFSIILSQISPEIISIIRDASQLSGIMTKPSRIRFFFEKWLFLVKFWPIKVSLGYFLTSTVYWHVFFNCWALFLLKSDQKKYTIIHFLVRVV